MDHAREEHLRKTITGACMLLAPVSFLISDSLFPATSNDAGEMLADVAGATGRVAAGTVFGMIGAVLMVGAVLGLAHMLHERRPGTALFGGAFAIAGAMAIFAILGVYGIVLFEAAQPGRDLVAMESLVDALITGPAMILGGATLFATVGSIVLAVGLARSRVVATWSAVCVALASVLLAVGNAAVTKPVILLGEAIMLAGLGSIGVVVLSETDEEWEHVPEFHGFARAAMG